MSSKLKIGVVVVVLLGMAAALFFQQQQIKRLQDENASLRTQLDQIGSLRDSNEHLTEQLKAAAETSQANQNELIRLRGQGVRLRQLEQENTQLKAQGQQLTQQLRDGQLAAASSERARAAAAADAKLATSAPPANVKDLGVIEISDGNAIRFDLGQGTNCVVTPTVLPDGNAQMKISVEVPNADGTASQLGQSTLTARPGQPCSISVGDFMIALTPKLKAP